MKEFSEIYFGLNATFYGIFFEIFLQTGFLRNKSIYFQVLLPESDSVQSQCGSRAEFSSEVGDFSSVFFFLFWQRNEEKRKGKAAESSGDSADKFRVPERPPPPVSFFSSLRRSCFFYYSFAPFLRGFFSFWNTVRVRASVCMCVRVSVPVRRIVLSTAEEEQ